MIESNTMIGTGTGIKVTCARDELAQKLAIVARAVSTRASVQILSGVLLTTRRIDGQFPNYKQLLPETFEHEVTLPRGEFLDVVRRVGVLVQRTSPIQLRFAEGELRVLARTQDVGESQETMPAPFSGEPMEIGFNAEFLREGIESIAAEDVRLRLISPLRPAVIEGGADDPTYLIMPIRLPG